MKRQTITTDWGALLDDLAEAGVTFPQLRSAVGIDISDRMASYYRAGRQPRHWVGDPKSQYVQALVAAINRKMDDEAVRAFFADRLVGENGTTTESFSASNQVGVSVGGTTSGLNVEKLQNALELLKAADVDLDSEPVYCVISPKQERNLMNEIEVISGDYTKGMVLESGRVSKFLGINFILSNRLGVDGSSYRRVPLFTPKAMSFCTWGGGMQTNVSQRLDKRGLPWQAYVEGHFGAVRRDSDKLIEIKCAEA